MAVSPRAGSLWVTPRVERGLRHLAFLSCRHHVEACRRQAVVRPHHHHAAAILGAVRTDSALFVCPARPHAALVLPEGRR